MRQHVYFSPRPELRTLVGLALPSPGLFDVDLGGVPDQLLLSRLELDDFVEALRLGRAFLQVG